MCLRVSPFSWGGGFLFSSSQGIEFATWELGEEEIGKIEETEEVKLTSFAHNLTRKATIKRLPGSGAGELRLLAVCRQKCRRIAQIYRIPLRVAVVSPEIPKGDLRIQGCWGTSAHIVVWRSAKLRGSYVCVSQDVWLL